MLPLTLRTKPLYDWVKAHASQDSAHDFQHLIRVTLNALELAQGEGISNDLILAAGLLHDIIHVPKNSPDRSKASELCAEEARRVLTQFEFHETEIHEVQIAIRDHSFSRGAVPTTPLGCVLQDADRLDALGAIGILRTAATGVVLGAQFYDALDPWALQRNLDDQRFTVDHFFKKLLKLPNTFCTFQGKQLAEMRAQFMIEFLGQLGLEIGNHLKLAPYAVGEIG